MSVNSRTNRANRQRQTTADRESGRLVGVAPDVSTSSSASNQTDSVKVERKKEPTSAESVRQVVEAPTPTTRTNDLSMAPAPLEMGPQELPEVGLQDTLPWNETALQGDELERMAERNISDLERRRAEMNRPAPQTPQSLITNENRTTDEASLPETMQAQRITPLPATEVGKRSELEPEVRKKTSSSTRQKKQTKAQDKQRSIDKNANLSEASDLNQLLENQEEEQQAQEEPAKETSEQKKKSGVAGISGSTLRKMIQKGMRADLESQVASQANRLKRESQQPYLDALANLLRNRVNNINETERMGQLDKQLAELDDQLAEALKQIENDKQSASSKKTAGISGDTLRRMIQEGMGADLESQVASQADRLQREAKQPYLDTLANLLQGRATEVAETERLAEAERRKNAVAGLDSDRLRDLTSGNRMTMTPEELDEQIQRQKERLIQEHSDNMYDDYRTEYELLREDLQDKAQKRSEEEYEKYRERYQAKRESYEKRWSRGYHKDFDEDQLYNEGIDVTDVPKDTMSRIKKIVYTMASESRDDYEQLKERSSKETSGVLGYNPDERESNTIIRLRDARNKIVMRLLNPSLLRIEGEGVETEIRTVNGQKRIFAKLKYDDTIESAMNTIQEIYDCSRSTVLRLIMLRGGIGVDSNGNIGGVDADEFKLSKQQTLALCDDIIRSQTQYGHPMGLIQDIPGGVRDDSGMFVVVAGTRCFPMGYVPLFMIHDMKRNVRSDWHNLSDREIQERISENWINNIHPALCSNTRGNLMWQARAIDNMMRALMTMDGRNPADLDIPEIQIRQTKMEIDAERASVTDDGIREANNVKEARLKEVTTRVTNRYKRMRGSRASMKDVDPGSLRSDNLIRKRTRVGDWFGSLNMLQRASKAANLAVMITSIPESMVADGQLRLGYFVTENILRNVNPDIMRKYEFTPDLDRIASSKQSVEAMQVADALYRIGGHDLIDLFIHEKGDDGRTLNRLNRGNLHEFLVRWGISPENTISDKLRQALHLNPNDEAGFVANMSRMLNILESFEMGSNLSEVNNARQFVRMSMTEMAMAETMRGVNANASSDRMRRMTTDVRESYTSDEVRQWGEGRDGGEEMIRSLLDTVAGREAFMTQGITGLGRKSPYEHAMRMVLSKNRVTEYAVRSMFDRFPEYGVNKVMNMVPYSNTMSFLASRGINNLGQLFEATNEDNFMGRLGQTMQRSAAYQVGNRASFVEGLAKNLMFDTIMAGHRLMIGAVYCGYIQLMGGIHPPEDKRDKYTWSEWRIGDETTSVPIKWAWFMDDLSGVGLPLGAAWAICMQDGFSPESCRTAANVFINAIANLNQGTAVMDAIDLVNNFDEEWSSFNKHGYEPSLTEWGLTTLEQFFWDNVGDLTPTLIGQLIPWSKDYLFKRGDAHDFEKIYDTDKYTLDEAKGEYHVKRATNYQDYMRRRASQSNVLMAIFYDMVHPDPTSADTSYKYGEMPVDTMTDVYTMQYWNKHYLDLDDPTDVPYDDLEDRIKELDIRADAVLKDLAQFATPLEARMSGFILNADARENCMRYCYRMIDQARDEMQEKLSHGRVPNDEYNRIMDSYYESRNYYDNIVETFLLSKEIPWELPKYVRQETDTETRYVDADGNAMSYLDMLGGKAEVESYLYGNLPGGLMPFTTPEDTGAYNYETPAWWNELGDNGKPLIDENGHPVLDENGEPVMDAKALARMRATNVGMYNRGLGMDEVSSMSDRYDGKDVSEMYWGGQGSNKKDLVSDLRNISPAGTPTIDTRAYRFMEEKFPEELYTLRDALKAADEQAAAASASGSSGGGDNNDYDDDNPLVDKLINTIDKAFEYKNNKGYGNGYNNGYYNKYSPWSSSRYPSSYARKAYPTYYGSDLDTYRPKIYSSSRNVSGDRAQGMDVRTPYKATTTYLRPNFYTKGSREAFERTDI